MPDSLRYFVNAGQLVAVVEPGRCDRFWSLWRRESDAAARLATRPDNEQLIARLIEERQDAAERKQAHLETCASCQAWMDANEHYADAFVALEEQERERVSV